MKYFLFSILLLCFLNTNAQITFEKGYYISNSNERVECYIKNLDWKNNTNAIKYKLNQDDTTILDGTISTISEFGIDNEVKYKRFQVNIEKSSDVLTSMSDNKNPVWQNQTLFLKVLVEGEATLYVYTESNSPKYFYQTKNTPLEQLICIKYITTETNSYGGTSFENSVKTNNQFRQQLYNNVKCDNMTIAEFEKISYDKSSLEKHFNNFNKCSGSGVSTYVAKKDNGVFLVKLTACVNSASLTIDAPVAYTYRHEKINKMVLGYGLELEYILPFNKNKWSLIASPSYNVFNYEKTNVINNGFGDVNHTTSVNYTYLELPLGLRYYMYLNKKAKLYTNAALAFSFDSNKKLIFDSHQELTIKSSSNLALGFGFNYNEKASIELNTNVGREILNNSYWSTKYNTFGLKLAYKLVQF